MPLLILRASIAWLELFDERVTSFADSDRNRNGHATLSR